MGRAMTSSAPASRSAMRSSTESVWAIASTGTATSRASALRLVTTTVASTSGRAVDDDQAGAGREVERVRTVGGRDDPGAEARDGARETRGLASFGAQEQEDRSVGSTAATLAGDEGGPERSDGAGTTVGPLPGCGPSEAPERASRAALLYSRARPFSSAVRVDRFARPNPSGAHPMGRSTSTRASL